jgi:hypothetical protein
LEAAPAVPAAIVTLLCLDLSVFAAAAVAAAFTVAAETSGFFFDQKANAWEE